MNLVKDLLVNAKLNNAVGRRDEIRKHLNYYSGTSTSQYIKNYFDSGAFKEIPPATTNFTRKLINKISRIYTLGANRNVGNKTQVYSELTAVKNVRMKHTERMTRLLGTLANRVYWDKNMFGYRPIYYFEAYFGEDPFIPDAIIYPLLHKVYDVSNTDTVQWAYWDNEKYCLLDDDGKVLKEDINPYGILPFVFTHREDQLDEFYVEGASDIVNCNEQINIGLTELNLGMRFNLFGQPWISGMVSDKTIVRAGSDTILDVGEGQFGIESPSGNVDEAIQNMKFQIELVASNNHLWIQWAESGGEVPSGISLMIKDLERKEDYYDDVALWKLYEQDFYRVERAIAEYNGINLPEQFAIDFEEVEYPMTVQDQILKDEFSLRHNLTTHAQILTRNNKDLSEEQAKIIIDNNRKDNESANQQSIFAQFRQEAGQNQ